MAEDLIVTLGLQDKGATKQITALNKEIRYLDKEFKTTQKTSKDYEKGTETLQKQLGLLEKKYEANQSKLTAYNKKMQETKTKLDEKKAALEELTSTEGANEKQVERLTNQIGNLEDSLRTTTRDINLTEAEMEKLNDEIKNTEQSIKTKPLKDFQKDMDDLGKKVESTGDKMKEFGSKTNAMGNNLLKLSAPIVAFGAYAIKASMDFETSMSKVEALSGATGKELEALENKAKEMGKTTSKSAKDSADAMSYMALAGWDTKEMLEGLQPILRLSEAGNLDLARTSDLTTDSLSALGLETKNLNRYLDIVAKTQASANTSAEGLMEAYIGAGGILKNLKVPLEESATYIGILANRGIKAAEAGKGLSSVLINMTSGAGQAGEAMEALNLSAYDGEGNFKGLNTVFTELGSKLSEYTQEQRDSYLAMIGGKTQIDTLNALLAGTSEEYSTLHTKVIKSDGALEKMAKTMQDNAQGNITKMKSKLEGLGIQIGENLLPHVNDFIDKLSDLIDWFGNLDEETQQSIMRFGAFTAVGGVSLKMIGGLTSGVGNLVSGIGKMIPNLGKGTKGTKDLGKAAKATGGLKGIAGLTKALSLSNPVTLGVTAAIAALGAGMVVAKTHAQVMGKSVVTASEDLSFMEKMVAKFTGTQFKSREELEASGLAFKKLSNTMSDEFKSAVEQAQDATIDFATFLTEVNFDSVLTEDEHAEFVERVNTMCNGAIATIKSKETETQESMRNLFNADQILTEEEIQTLAALERISLGSITEIEDRKAQILQIGKNALANDRELNAEEISQIQAHEAEIRRIELEAVGGTQEELLFAKNEFATRIKTMSAEQAEELLAEKRKELDENRIQIQASYDTEMEMLKGKMSLMTEEERANAEVALSALQLDRENKLAEQNGYWQDYLDLVNEKNPALNGVINQFNGEMLTQEDKARQETLGVMTSRYQGLQDIVETGAYSLYNTQKKSYDDLQVVVDEATGKVVAAYSHADMLTGGISESMADSVRTIGKEFGKSSDRIKGALGVTGDASINTEGNVVTSNGKIIGSLQDVIEAADGTKQGFVNLNGEKIEIKHNAQGVITNFDELKRSIDKVNKKVTINVHTNYSSSGTAPHSSVYNQKGYSVPSNDYAYPAMNLEGISTLPTTYENMIVEPTYYNSESPILRELNRLSAPPQSQSQGTGVDYNIMAEVIAKAVTEAISKLKIEPNFEASIDGTAISTTISSKLAMGVKGRR